MKFGASGNCLNLRQWYSALMAVRLFYVDESYDDTTFCLSALSIRHTHWKECFDLVKAHRRQLKVTYGIPLYKQIHSRDFVRGRGRVSKKGITKWERSRIFLSFLHLAASLPTAMVFNVCLPKKGLADAQMTAWDRLTNRIERTMRKFDEHEQRVRSKICDAVDELDPPLAESERNSLKVRLNLFRARAIIIADQGRENEITTALRRMHVHNLIPSQFGKWESGLAAKNITTDRIIEDPFFKPSGRSYFLQLADCIAYALLKQEVVPTPHVKKYGIDGMFPVLDPVLYKRASPRDKKQQGVVRA
jgi:hypothetical protein